MTLFFDLKNIPFFKTNISKCPYLENKKEQKIVTWLKGKSAEQTHNLLLKMGFRRSQTIIYKPNCPDCNACKPLRISVVDFVPSKSQKRVLKKNSHIKRKITSPRITKSHFDLYQKYMNHRHIGEDMSFMDFNDVSMMVEETNIDTCLIEYYMHNKLIGWSLSDHADDGISMVYTVFDPDLSEQSLGTFSILDQIDYCKQLGFDYIYLGYWIKDSKKMSYKNKFIPHEIFDNNIWNKVA